MPSHGPRNLIYLWPAPWRGSLGQLNLVSAGPNARRRHVATNSGMGCTTRDHVGLQPPVGQRSWWCLRIRKLYTTANSAMARHNNSIFLLTVGPSPRVREPSESGAVRIRGGEPTAVAEVGGGADGARRWRGHRRLAGQWINGGSGGGALNRVRILGCGVAVAGELRQALLRYRGGLGVVGGVGRRWVMGGARGADTGRPGRGRRGGGRWAEVDARKTSRRDVGVACGGRRRGVTRSPTA
jgi:hypothetical protein